MNMTENLRSTVLEKKIKIDMFKPLQLAYFGQHIIYGNTGLHYYQIMQLEKKSYFLKLAIGDTKT